MFATIKNYFYILLGIKICDLITHKIFYGLMDNMVK